MIKNKGLLFGIVGLVLVTSILSFSLSAFIFMGREYTKPSYDISFSKDKVSSDSIKKFNDIRSILENNYYQNVDENTLLEGAVAGMADSLKDPYTVYFTKDQMKSFMEKSEGSYVGIGVSITLDKDGLVSIAECFDGSPAKSAGVATNDKIIKVDDKDVSAIRDENVVVSMIKGQEGTKVKVTVYRPSNGKTIDFDLVRKKIKISNIKSEVLPGNIGYIKLMSFDNEIDKYFEDNLNALLQKKIKGLIIDLRDNPGGSYEQVVEIADRLLPKGLIVFTKDKAGNKEEKLSNSKELGLPMAVLINGNSASASEILAGAIKDHHKGKLIGTKTFGKGVVQSIIPLKDGSGLKVTIARYFTPSGVCIHGVGIAPDIEVKLDQKYDKYPVSQVPRQDDTQLKAAEDVINSANQ